MYENLTYEELIEKKLGMVDNTVDKRQGSIIYDTLAPNSAESIQMYMAMEALMDRTFADTATGEDLERRTAERNIQRKAATNANVKAVFYDQNNKKTDVEIGSRMSGGGNDYYVCEKLSDGSYTMVCETAGEAGNKYTGKIVPIDYVDGLLSAEITSIIIYGEEKEDDESLRKRYFESFEIKAFGGNIDEYKKLLNSIDGVGGGKIYPAFNGGGTVKLTIIDNGYNVPDEELIKNVQNYIDPDPKGSGIGAVPIGHSVTIEGVREERINIEFSLTVEEGYEKDYVIEEAKKNIEEYFLELRKSWADEKNTTVRSSRIEMKVLDVMGIVDIENIKLNGKVGNIVVAEENIPILGTVENI